jgi:ADP-ribosyl-[dinitrogen reductase] hydrolase
VDCRTTILRPKTSESNPLRISPVSIDGVRGRIGLTICPGKKLGSNLSGALTLDLDADLKAIQSFGAVALVTLMEDHELRYLSVLPDQLQAPALTYNARRSVHGQEE